MKKPPSFPFYASDFLGSGKVARMTLEHQGAYVRLLCFQWTDGSIPNDLSQLAALCHVPLKQMERLWPTIKVCFKQHPSHPGELINQRLEDIREEKEAFRQKQAENGRRGGRPASSTKNLSHNPDETQSKPKNNPSLSSGETQTITQKKPSLSSLHSPVSKSIPEDLSKHSKSLAREKASERASGTEIEDQSGNEDGKTNDPKDPEFRRRLWSPIEQGIRKNVDPETFAKYYAGIEIKALTGSAVVLAVPDALIQRNKGSCAETTLVLWDQIKRHKSDLFRDRKLIVSVLEDSQ